MTTLQAMALRPGETVLVTDPSHKAHGAMLTVDKVGRSGRITAYSNQGAWYSLHPSQCRKVD